MLRFPAREEVRLGRSPLHEVVCQVRFPPILRIANEQPAEFQERVRRTFPKLSVEHTMRVKMDPLGSPPSAMEPQPRLFRFHSVDGHTAISLAVNFFAVSTMAYTHWEDFLDQVRLASDVAQQVYDPLHATRIGLRYINQLTMDNTGSNSLEELVGVVRQELLIIMNQDAWDAPLQLSSQWRLAGQEDGESMNVRVTFDAGKNPVVTLDFDYFSEGEIPLEGLESLCRRYHDLIYRAFRWCIRDERLCVFQPHRQAQEG